MGAKTYVDIRQSYDNTISATCVTWIGQKTSCWHRSYDCTTNSVLFVFYLYWAKTYVDAKSYYDHTNSAICVFYLYWAKNVCYVDVCLTTSSQMMIISTAFLNLKRHVHWAKKLPSRMRMRMIISTTFLPWLFALGKIGNKIQC